MMRLLARQAAWACMSSMLPLSAAYPQAAGGAVEDANPSPDDVGDIVVTAQRVQSLASRTPVALRALSGDDLAAKTIETPQLALSTS